MTDRQRYNLALSRRMAEGQQARPIRCPYCGMRLLDAYGHGHNVVSVKCPKCKAEMILDTSLFRKVRSRPRYGLSYGWRGTAGWDEEDWEPSPFLPSLGRFSR